MENTRKFIASSNLFSDFTVNISLENVTTMDEIIEVFTNEIKKILKKNNFTMLIKKLNESHFHIHSYTIEDILKSESEDIFYICDHQ